MLSEFDDLVKQRKQLKKWWSNFSKTTYRGDGYTLRVDFGVPVMVAICGQEYAGGPNYHEAPKEFKYALTREMDSRAYDLVLAAYKSEIERMDGLIAKHKEAVLAELGREED